jgi:hypothetical protein
VISVDPQAVEQFALNGIDRYFVAHDYPGLHFLTHHIVETDQKLNCAKLNFAVQSILDDLPLARSYIVEGRLRARRLVAARGRVSASDVLSAHEVPVISERQEGALLQRPLALGHAPPWRVLHYPRGSAFRLVLSIHHSMGDATAGAALLNLLIARYNDALAGRALMPAPSASAPYQLRELFRPEGVRWFLRMIGRYRGPRAKLGAASASLLDDERCVQGETAFHVVPFTPGEWAALERLARRRGCTRDDLLVAAALRAADEGRRAAGKADGKFRILLPTNLRPSLKWESLFQNCIGFVRADFTADEARGAELVALVAQRLELGRQIEAAAETPVGLALLSNLLPPALFRWSLKKLDANPRSFSSSFLFSHIRVPGGAVFPDGASVIRYFITTTVPRQPGFGYVVTDIGNAIAVTLQYQRNGISESSVERYERGFVEQLRRWIAAENGGQVVAMPSAS